MAEDDVEDVIHTETQDASSVGMEDVCEYNTDKEWWEVTFAKEDSDLKFPTVNVHHLDNYNTSDGSVNEGEVEKDMDYSEYMVVDKQLFS